MTNKELFKWLKDVGCETVSAEFNGEGDSGGIEDIHMNGKDASYIEITPTMNWEPVRAKLEGMFYAKMEAIGADFNNEGCYGNCLLVLKDKQITVTNHVRYTEYNTDEEVYDIEDDQ